MTALLSIFMVQTALAQHDTTKVERRQHRHAKHIDKEMRLDEVVVVANGVGRVKQSAFNTLAVDTREMQNTTKNLSDALAKAPGLKLRESGRVGSDMSLMIDGFSGNHVKIFIDGVPQEGVGALFGLNNIPVSFANRIEVYKGVVPVGFGTDAIGGVVNVVTNRRHSGWHLDASYSYGSFNTHKTNLSFGQTFKGELTGTQYPDECWVAIFDNEKLDGIAWGKLLTGISTLFMVFILLTGILMWLTNRNKPLKKSLVIHLRSGWPRFWHDLHVAGGIYATMFLLALALTGLTWSFSWYRTGFYACFGVESSGGGSHGGQHGTEQSDHNRGGSGRGERGGRGEHGGREGHGEHGGYHGHGDGGGYHDHGGDGGFFGFGGHRRSPYRHWQEVLDEVAKKNPGYRQIAMKSESAEVIPAGRASLRAADTYSFNRRSGEITDVKLYSSQGKDAKVRGAVYTVHMGSWGGTITRLLTFLSALIGCTLPLTGYYLWIRRLVRKK